MAQEISEFTADDFTVGEGVIVMGGERKCPQPKLAAGIGRKKYYYFD